jgi:hypothetical protein
VVETAACLLTLVLKLLFDHTSLGANPQVGEGRVWVGEGQCGRLQAGRVQGWRMCQGGQGRAGRACGWVHGWSGGEPPGREGVRCGRVVVVETAACLLELVLKLLFDQPWRKPTGA